MHISGRALSLRVPLSNIHSTTYAFYPDETHKSIRRVFTPQYAPTTKRHFCGFCGTPLSNWSEESSEEAEWVYVNLSSLRRDSMEKLEDAGFLLAVSDESENSAENENPQSVAARTNSRTNVGEGRETSGGTPWFEEMIEGSELGRIKRRRGGGRSSDGKTIVEYEITEFEGAHDAERGASGTGKRKLGSLGDEPDVEMRSG